MLCQDCDQHVFAIKNWNEMGVYHPPCSFKYQTQISYVGDLNPVMHVCNIKIIIQQEL